MPLCTIFTKCPAPPGPIHSQQGWPSSVLAAMACKNGLTIGHASAEPPGIKAGPFKAPSSPPLTPVPTYKMPVPSSESMRRCVSRYRVLPPSMITSPGDSKGHNSLSTASTGAPAGTISQTRRGHCKLAANSAKELAAPAFKPSVRLANLARLFVSKSKPVTLKPFRSKFSAKFSPMTPKPMSPMVVCMGLFFYQCALDFRMDLVGAWVTSVWRGM